MSRIIVERSFQAPVTDAEMAEVANRERPCLGIYNVQWKRSLLGSDRMRMVCEYEAADAETVRKVQREARAEFDRIWVAEVVE
ncbi:MAG: nickel-binding protein [Rhizobacter sp.]